MGHAYDQISWITGKAANLHLRCFEFPHDCNDSITIRVYSSWPARYTSDVSSALLPLCAIADRDTISEPRARREPEDNARCDTGKVIRADQVEPVKLVADVKRRFER